MSSSPRTDLEKLQQTTTWYHINDVLNWAESHGVSIESETLWNKCGQPFEGVIDTLWVDDDAYWEEADQDVIAFLNLCRDNDITEIPIWW